MNPFIQLLAASAALIATSQVLAETTYGMANVISVTPLTEQVNVPRRECWEERVTTPSDRSAGGAVLGGLAGALVGSRLGGGHGRDAATVAGAIGGAVVGDRIASEPRQTDVQRCRVVEQWSRRTTGYRVTYEYAGREHSAILSRDPGRTLPVRVTVEPQ